MLLNVIGDLISIWVPQIASLGALTHRDGAEVGRKGKGNPKRVTLVRALFSIWVFDPEH